MEAIYTEAHPKKVMKVMKNMFKHDVSLNDLMAVGHNQDRGLMKIGNSVKLETIEGAYEDENDTKNGNITIDLIAEDLLLFVSEIASEGFIPSCKTLESNTGRKIVINIMPRIQDNPPEDLIEKEDSLIGQNSTLWSPSE